MGQGNREAALEYDKYSVGIFRQKDSEENELVGHAPVFSIIF